MSSAASCNEASEDEEKEMDGEEDEKHPPEEEEEPRREEEEEETVDDPRAWWVLQRVWVLLGFPNPIRVPLLEWQETPCEDDHLAPLTDFLDKGEEGSCLTFWSPVEEKEAEHEREDGRKASVDEECGRHWDADRPTAIGTTTTFSWKFDTAAEEDEPEDDTDPNFKVETYTTQFTSTRTVFYVQVTASPSVVGVGVVQAKKVKGGLVPYMNDNDEATDLMPYHLHLTFIYPDTHRGLHSMFHQLYLPLCERLGKNDRTAYLSSLAHNFSRLSELKAPDPPLDYNSDDDEDAKKSSAPRGSARDAGEEGEEDEAEVLGGEEDHPRKRKSPRGLLLHNAKRVNDKYSQPIGDVSLGDLRLTWTSRYMELSSYLSHIRAHPLTCEAERAVLKASEAEGGADGAGGEGAVVEAAAPEVVETKVLPKGKEATKVKEARRARNREAMEAEEMKRLSLAARSMADLHNNIADCYRSLFYLEKFFRIVGEGNLETLSGHAAALLEILEIVWRVGRRDGISCRVQLILESAVQSLVNLVTKELRPVNLLPSGMREQLPFLDSQARVKRALQVVGEWESATAKCAESVQHSAKRQRDGRQDFDPKKVLGTIASLRSVCEDLDDIMKVLLEAQMGSSGEWSALIRVQDPEQLKNTTAQVLRVLTAYDFNIFSSRNQDRWVRQKDDFQLAVQKWEQAVINAIKESFKDRMTSELVTAVAGVLAKEPCRACFRQILISRLPDLLSAFAAEVKGIRADFQAQQKVERPGTQAPLSGRVRWMTSYLTKRLAAWTTLKQLYSEYQGSSAGGELWAEVGAEVEEVQKEVEQARANMVLQWSERVTQKIPKLLVTPVLTRDPKHEGVGGWRVQLPGELQCIVWEAGQLQQAGIRPPQLAAHLTLHYQTLQTAAMGLHLTLKDYHTVLDQLSPVQRELLRAELAGADRVLAAGQRVVTWSPAALTHFSTCCRGVVEHVRTIATRLVGITQRLEDLLDDIVNTCLLEVTFDPEHIPIHPPSLHELLDECSHRREEEAKKLTETYDTLVRTLSSAGLLVAGAEDGAPESLAAHIRAAPELRVRLAPFLKHWRANVQEAITMMLLNSIRGFEKCLEGDAVVFGVECSLTPTSALTLSPPARSLSCTLAGALGHTVRTAMIFRHWVELDDGTVVLNPAPTADDDTLAASTFYCQVSTDSRLHDAIDSIQTTFASVIKELDKDLQGWYSYEHVWRRDKASTVTKFCARGPSVKQYDDKLRFYTHLASELSQARQQVTHGCVSLDVRKLVGQVVGHTSEWVKLLGTGLMKEARSRLQHVLHKVTTVNKDLQTAPEDLVALTVVMRAIGRVSQDHAHLHTALLDVRQMFHTLKVYGIVVPQEDYEQLEETSARLDVLHHTATSVQKNIEPVQSFFLANTQKKVTEFKAVAQRFYERFESQGPGAVGEDLDKGVTLLKEYTEEVSLLLDQRRILDEEEDVFDLAATQYPGLDSAMHVMDQMKDVFNVYRQLKEIETTWRTMRWATAKLDELKTQVEEVREALMACSGAQETEVGRSLLQRLGDHTTSLEVTAALRQPAVQPRHWQYLVTAAGCAGNWASAAGLSGVSVWDVLELRLSRHPLLVATTVASAVRENLLSRQMKEITRFWQRARLCVLTTSTVWRVGGLEEQMATLHHHNLALKTLRATKYCKPFEEEARRLAKTLVAVGSLLEVWHSAQTDISPLLSAAVSSLIEGASNLRVKHRQLLERTERRSFVLELAANPSYIEEVSSLHDYARHLISELSEALGRPRRHCPRLHFLTDVEVMGLMADPRPETLNRVVGKIFNNVSAVKHEDGSVTGLLSTEGEHLALEEPVSLLQETKNMDLVGLEVGVGVQQVVEATQKAVKGTVHTAIEDLGRETKIQRTMLHSTNTGAMTVAWRVWWAASVDLALHARAKGDRHAVRELLTLITEDITMTLAAMGRGHGPEHENHKEIQDEEAMPLSTTRTPPSACSQATAGKASLQPLPPPRLLPLLMATLHARDVVATLVRNNTSTARSFSWVAQPRYTWQPQHEHLQLHAAHRAVDYGYEYTGCGAADYVFTPATERSLLALFTAIAAHSPPLVLGGSGGGRQSLIAAASHMAGRFSTSFTLSALTSPSTLTALLTGSVVGGTWLVLRACSEATPTLLAALAATLLLMHRAHATDTATPVIQIDGHEATVHPGVAVLLCRGATPTDRATTSLPHSLDTLCRPVRVAPPPPRTLVFSWLLAHNVPKAQEVSEAINEVTRQVLESYSGHVISGLRLYHRVTKEVIYALASNSVTPMEAAILAFRQVMLPRLPLESHSNVTSVLELLNTAPPAALPSPSSSDEYFSDRMQAEKLLQKLGLRSFPKQIEAVESVVRGVKDWGGVIVRGPPRSGKTTVINIATKLLTIGERNSQRTPSTAQRTSGTQAQDTFSTRRSQATTMASDGTEGLDIEILHSNRQLLDRHVYTIRPQTYEKTALIGSSSQNGLLSRLLQRLSASSAQSVIILEGPRAAECLERLQDLPGKLMLESLKVVESSRNVTFLIEAREDEPLPKWIMGRSSIVQLDPATLSPASLLPSPTLTPPPPLSDRHSHSSATPRSSSKPSTPQPVDSARSLADDGEPTPAMLVEYLVHRLLQPLIDLLGECPTHQLVPVDLIRQIEALLGESLTSVGSGEDLTAGEVGRVIEALVQGTRTLLDGTLMPKILQTLQTSLKQVVSDGLLKGPCLEVVESLSSCVPIDFHWDNSSASWSPWTPSADGAGDELDGVKPTVEITRLRWFLEQMMKSGVPSVVIGSPATGKSTTAIAAMSSINGWTTEVMGVTPTTSPEDLEAKILSLVTRTSFDNLTPKTPVILCFDDIGCLPAGGKTQSFLRSVAFHRGIFTNDEGARWAELVDIYFVGVCTRRMDQWAQSEGVVDLSGWAAYHMGGDRATCISAVSESLEPIGSLQSQIIEALTSTTETIAKRIMQLPGQLDEAFGPASPESIMWLVASSLDRLFRIPSTLTSSSESSTGTFILRAWLHILAVRLYYPMHSNKRRDHVWSEIQACVNEGCGSVVGEAPATPPLPFWPLRSDTPPEAEGEHDPGPSFMAPSESASCMAKALSKLNNKMAVHEHIGISSGVALVVDALHTLQNAHGTQAAPFFLLLGAPSRDKDIIIDLAVAYLGVVKVTGVSNEEVLEAVREVDANETERERKELVHVPASFLVDREIMDAVLKMTSKPITTAYSRIVVVSGSREEVWPLQMELRQIARHGRVLCLPAHDAAHHEIFVAKLLTKHKTLKGIDEHTFDQVSAFMAHVHECFSKAPEGDLLTTPVGRAPLVRQPPSVAALEEMASTFVRRFQARTEFMQKTLHDLKAAVGRVGELENHVTSLKTSNTCLEATLEEAAADIAKIKENLEQRESDIETHEKGVADLKTEAARVERAAQELSGEVEEYVTETKAPLVEITNSLAELDMPRIRKLLSRSPISAIQVVFECSVALITNQEVTWRGVRHATQDENFCKKLAAICVPGLKQAQIAMLTEKLEQIKMTPEHLSRVSDIGGVFLQYLRTAIFFWHRYHEDVQPRQERVQELKDQCTQLQVEMATKERLIRGHKDEVSKLSSKLKAEEGRVIDLKRKKIDVEEELANVMTVITELQPHAERWREKIKQREKELTEITGKCLLESARLTYLSALSPRDRSALTRGWEDHLVSEGFLAERKAVPQQELKLVLRAGELQPDVEEVIQHYTKSTSLLLLRDPHYLVEEYVRGGVWINVETASWRERVEERLSVTPRTPIYLWVDHPRAVEVVSFSKGMLGDGDTGGLRILLVLQDSCSGSPCPLCSTLPTVDLALDDRGIVHQLVQTVVRWHDPQLEEQMVKTVQVATAAREGKEAAEGALIRALIHASKSTSAEALDSFMDHVEAFNNAITTSDEQDKLLTEVTTKVSERYLLMSVYAGLLHRMSTSLASLDVSYSLPLRLVHENLANRMDATEVGEGENIEDRMLQAVTESVFELVDTRLQLRHRPIVAACYALARANLEHPNEDYVMAFLRGVEPPGRVWEGVWKGRVDKKVEEEDEKKEKEEEEDGKGSKEDEEDEEKEDDEEEEKEEEKEVAVEEKGDEEEEEEIETLDWLPHACDSKTRRVLSRLIRDCPSLFPSPDKPLDEEESAGLLKWVDKTSSDWPNIFPCSGSLMKAAQQVVLSRHLRPDQLSAAITDLVEVPLGHGSLTPLPDVLSQAVTQHSRSRKTKRCGLSDIIQVIVGRGVDPARMISVAAKRIGLPFYKLTFLSLATASKQELRRRVVMAARRRTWLVLLDCEVAPHALPYAHAALLALPRTLPTPAVLCVVADGSPCAEKLQCAVVAQIERPLGLASTLATYLPVALTRLESNVHPSGSSNSYIQAAMLITAYAHSLLSVRGEYGTQGWHRRPLLPETLLVEALEAARHHATTSSPGTPAWDVLAKLLSKVAYGSVLDSSLDQLVVDQIFSDHLNSQLFPAKKRLRHADSQQTDTPTEETRQTSESRAETAELFPEEGREDTTQIVSQQQPRVKDEAILLHSFPEKDLTLNLHLPPQQVAESLSADAGVREGELLGLVEDNGKRKGEDQLMETLKVFDERPTVRIPSWAVLGLVAELQASLRGPVGLRAAIITREEDLETLAWKEETRLWDTTLVHAQRRLKLIQDVMGNGAVRPAAALRILSDLVQNSALDPEISSSLAGVRASAGETRAGQENTMSVEAAWAVVRASKMMCEEWRARYKHLLTWADKEVPPVCVRLGLLAEPGWFLTRLREAVCTRAHWPLHGSIVYGRPGTPAAERPPQGVYASGIRLIGGRWTGSEVIPGEADVDHPLTLTLTVSHALPPTPVGWIWVPMASRCPSGPPLFPVMLRLHASYNSIRTPLHLVSLASL